MTREDLDFIGSMNMCDEISNDAYKKIVCHCEEQNSILDKIRDEIADLDDADYDHEGYYKAVTDAVKIIDKYKAERSDKE